jgi:hypothetical protein
MNKVEEGDLTRDEAVEELKHFSQLFLKALKRAHYDSDNYEVKLKDFIEREQNK